MDEPVRSRLRATGHRGLTRPDPVTAPARPQRPPARTSPAKDPDKPQNRSAAGKLHPKSHQDHLSVSWRIQTSIRIYAVDRGLGAIAEARQLRNVGSRRWLHDRQGDLRLPWAYSAQPTRRRA
jgi:hypothetical protein